MEPCRTYIGAGGCHAPGGLDEEGHGEALVKEAELAGPVKEIGGVHEDAAVQQSAVDVGNHGADVPQRVPLLLPLGPAHKLGRREVPDLRVTRVDGDDPLWLGRDCL